MKKLSAVFCFILLFAGKANANTHEYSYDFYSGGANSVKTKILINIEDNRYNIKTITETKGFIGFIYPVKSTRTSTGYIKNEKFYPSKYVIKTETRGGIKEKIIDYNEEGRAIKKTNIKKGKTYVTDVSENEKGKNAVDFQTVFIQMLYSMAKDNDCNKSFDTFDGKRGFTLKFIDKGKDKLTSNRYFNFDGEAKYCELQVIPKGKVPSDSWFWHRNGEKRNMPLGLWFAENKELPSVVKLKIDSIGFGAIFAYMDINDKEN